MMKVSRHDTGACHDATNCVVTDCQDNICPMYHELPRGEIQGRGGPAARGELSGGTETEPEVRSKGGLG